MLPQLWFRTKLGARYLGGNSSSDSFGTEKHSDTIQRIYVINLDREPDRWRQISRELRGLRDRSGKPLAAMSRRFSAVDARYYRGLPSGGLIQPQYSLADQLFVQPEPRLDGTVDAQARAIEMTPQEVAVALSHIEVWKLIAKGDPLYTLVLEDDVYFRSRFARILDNAWTELIQRTGLDDVADMVYLSYEEAVEDGRRRPFSELLFRPITGLWQLSGYVLSRTGARNLLSLLPVRGPVDLWLNHQFTKLDVFATRTPIIVQRPDLPTTNSYSVLPTLSAVGVITREKPLLVKGKTMQGPVFAFGKSGTGTTSLAMALSMLGYRCCCDVSSLPPSEQADLFGKRRSRVFDAYVNMGTLNPDALIELAKVYHKPRFIMTIDDEMHLTNSMRAPQDGPPEAFHAGEDRPSGFLTQLSEEASGNVLVLPAQHPDKWELLCAFLGCEYPAHAYPECQDQVQRQLVVGTREKDCDQWPDAKRLKWDSSPWIVPNKDWHGLRLAEAGNAAQGHSSSGNCLYNKFGELDSELWILRDDTFPSNLAIFKPSNFAIGTDCIAQLTLREESTSVRRFTSASIASRRRFQYGRFVAEVKPSNVQGLITGVFLHRNAPRQEIDLEFLGRDTTQLLVNVYCNPGDEGTKLEYGYRGTPVLIDLGFDASSEFHRYEIEWCSDFIRWRVDGRLVHERAIWEPTPIPHLPMQFNINLWHSRSKELAGKLASGDLPARSYIRCVDIQ